MKSTIFVWIFLVVIISLGVVAVISIRSLHDSAERAWWNLKDASDYVFSPSEKKFFPKEESFNDCQKELSYLVPDYFLLERYKGSEQWYLVNSSWTDGLRLPEKTFSFSEILLPDGTYLLRPSHPSKDTLPYYQRKEYDSSTGILKHISRLVIDPTLRAVPGSWELVNSSKLFERELFSISSYSVVECVNQ